MNLNRKIENWQQAGLLDAATAEGIRAFEATHRKPLLLHGLAGLGAATVGLGIISIVAANWSGIGYPMKLAADLLLGIVLAAAIFFAHAHVKPLAKEALVLVYYLFTLASIALLGQIYQTGTPIWQALLIWSAVTLPLMLLARSTIAAGLWFVGIGITYAAGMGTWVDKLGSPAQANAVTCIAFGWPILMIVFSGERWCRRERSRIAGTWSSLSWLWIFAGALMLTFLFYADPSSDRLTWALPLTGAMAIGLHFLLPYRYPEAPSSGRTGLTAVLVCGWLILAIGMGFDRDEWNLAAALSQVMLLGVFAWTSVQFGRTRTFNVLTALIALRILIIYFEVFGSMLSTGVGMISGGGLTLMMAWLWKRKSSHLAAQLTAGEQANA